MRIYSLSQETDMFNRLSLKNFKKDRDILELLQKGIPLKDNWKTLKVGIDKYYSSHSDYPHGIPIPIISATALEFVKDLIFSDNELLSIDYPNREYSIINILNITNCLDISEAVPIHRYGTVVGYEKFILSNSDLKNKHIFRISIPKSQLIIPNKVFVTDTFKSRVEDSTLKGFVFKEVGHTI